MEIIEQYGLALGALCIITSVLTFHFWGISTRWHQLLVASLFLGGISGILGTILGDSRWPIVGIACAGLTFWSVGNIVKGSR